MLPEDYERQDIEVLNEVRPYCFESDREEQWFKVGLQYGLDAADAEPLTRWISVGDDLPCNHKELIDHESWGAETKQVLVRYANIFCFLDYMVYKEGKWIWYDNYCPHDEWMIIPEI